MGRHCAPADARWARCRLARMLRELIVKDVLGAAMDIYTSCRVVGRRRFDGLEEPVVFVANHSSHMDTPTILRALPRKWRQRTAVAAASDYFYRKRRIAYVVSLAFNTVPMRRNGGGLEPNVTFSLDRLLRERWNLLVFAEGTRSRDGRVGRLRSGAAVLAAEHGLVIVPIHVSGTHAAMPPGQRWMRWRSGRFIPRRHPIEVRFGEPIRPRDGERPAEVMERVRLFFAASGAVTTPDQKLFAGNGRPATREPAKTA